MHQPRLLVLPIQHNVNMISFLLRMKRILLIIAAAFCLLPSAQARGIVGKWYCSKAFFDSLGLGVMRYYPNIKGYYKFKKDGTFNVRIDGNRLSERSSEANHVFAKKNPRWMKGNAKYQTLLIKVRGLYRFEGNRITAKVDTNDVYVDIDTGLDYPDEPGASASWNEFYFKNSKRNIYEVAEQHAVKQAKVIKGGNMHIWQWKELPVTVTKDTLWIGGAMAFTKKKMKVENRYRVVTDSMHLTCDRIPTMEAHSAKEKLRKGKGSAKQRLRAVETLKDVLKHDSCAYWAYYIGAAYADGRMGKADSANALLYLGMAARVGYGKAYNVMGRMYKDGRGGVGQNFEKAYQYFCKGADCEDRECMYYKGYMQTKGLGCKQSYEEAVRSLLPAANWPDAKSLFMLGVFLRNGYGLERDLPLAAYCLKRAARMRCKEASDELKRLHEETYMHAVYADSAEYSFIPDSLPAVKPTVGGAALAEGHYSGFVVTYDWSGKYILGEQPFAMTVSSVGGELSGELSIDSVDTAYRGSLFGCRLVFASGGVTLPERYERGGKMDYRLDSMVLDVADGKVTGRLNLYSTKLKEPGRPMYFELRRE